MLLLIVTNAKAQYNLVGTAKAIAGTACYQLTESKKDQAGSIWYEQQLDLRHSFSLEFTLNFDVLRDGADGIMFVMQTVGPKALGSLGGGLGFGGISPSLGIEFDTYRNETANDPPYDHIAILRDGDMDHLARTNLAGPVPVLPQKTNIKDGEDYRVRIEWNSHKQQITVFVNCEQRISLQMNVVQDIYEGRSNVWWGFSSATGYFFSKHTVCLSKDIVKKDTFQICEGETVTLLAHQSPDNKYSWSPANLLDNPTSRTPVARLTKSQLFTVTSQDYCGKTIRDTVFVEVRPKPSVSLGAPVVQVCNGQLITLNPQISSTVQPEHYRWSTGEVTASINVGQPGTYRLEATANGCSTVDSVQVQQLPLPKIGTSPTRPYCLDDEGIAHLSITPLEADLQFLWEPTSSTGSSLIARQEGEYRVLINNPVGCTISRTLRVAGICPPVILVPDAFSPNNDGINDTFLIRSKAIAYYELFVYNRWGTVIFHSTSLEDHWNGTYHNEPCQPGVYTFRINYRTSLHDHSGAKMGQILLIR